MGGGIGGMVREGCWPGKMEEEPQFGIVWMRRLGLFYLALLCLDLLRLFGFTDTMLADASARNSPDWKAAVSSGI